VCDTDSGCFSVSENIDAGICRFDDADHSLIALLRKKKKAVDLHALGEAFAAIDIRDEEKERLVKAGVILSVPMFLQDRLIGFINLGPKMSGRGYSEEDRRLLETVAAQAAIAIENARLHQAEIERRRIQEEMELARTIQQGLFPRESPKLDGLEISGISVPAETFQERECPRHCICPKFRG
jgi:GAF domain-containing protein